MPTDTCVLATEPCLDFKYLSWSRFALAGEPRRPFQKTCGTEGALGSKGDGGLDDLGLVISSFWDINDSNDGD